MRILVLTQSTETIADLLKDFDLGEAMQNILDRSQQVAPARRWNSLEILEEIHKHRHQIKEPFTSFESLLGGKTGGFTYQAFIIISDLLDTVVPFEAKSTKEQRQEVIDRLELLLEDGAADTYRTHSSSLQLAVLLDKKEVFNKLLSQRWNTDEAWPKSGWTALHLAAQENKKDFVDILLTTNTTPNTRDKFGLTPLHYASKAGHAEIQRLLETRSRVIRHNMAYDQAMMVNGPIGEDTWATTAHITVSDNLAKGKSVQVNHFISSDQVRLTLEALNMARK
jgi:hypothetical protein